MIPRMYEVAKPLMDQPRQMAAGKASRFPHRRRSQNSLTSLTRRALESTSRPDGPAQHKSPRLPIINRADASSRAAVMRLTAARSASRIKRSDRVNLTEGSRHSRTYRLHAYWSKKPHEILRECIASLTEPGDVVLDPFCGSGGTLVVAAMLGRTVIGIDRSPAAVFISQGALTLPPATEIKAAWANLRDKVEPDIRQLYTTVCHRCNGAATIRYTVIADLLKCPGCRTEFSADRIARSGNVKRCPACDAKLPRSPEILGSSAVETSAECEAGCRPRAFKRRHDDRSPRAAAFFDQHDLAKIREIDAMPIPAWHPSDKFPPGLKTAELFNRGIEKIDAIFTRRNFMSVAMLRQAIDELATDQWMPMLFCLSAAVTSLTLKSQHVQGGGGYLPGMYYIPPVRKERNPLFSLRRIVSQVASGADEMHAGGDFHPRAWVGLGSAADLSVIGDESVDFAFLDPPYSDKIQYSELNFVWESCLGLVEEWGDEEIVINRARGKSLGQWQDRVNLVAGEVFRVLRPGGRVALTYDDPKRRTWPVLLNALKQAGFDALSTDNSYSVKQQTFVQRRSPKASQRDTLTVFGKP